MSKLILFISVFVFVVQSFGQTKYPTKFKKVAMEDFTPVSSVIDSSTDAVVLFDVASSDFEGNNAGDFSLIFKRHRRVLIKKRTAFDQATVSVPLFSLGSSTTTEKLTDLQASTYYIDNGLIVEKKIEKTSILTEKVNRAVSLTKFTFPDVQQGCILDYSYVIKSPFYDRLKSWVFQGKHPILWSEYTVTIPHLFDYVTTQYGYLPYNVDTLSKKFQNYTINVPNTNAGMSSELYRFSGDAITNTWVIKNAPPFKDEPFVSTMDNHLTQVRFQLRAILYSESNIRNVVKDWPTTAEDLMKDEDFSKDIYSSNDWLNSQLATLSKDASGLDLAMKIYAFVRDNYTCNDKDAQYLSQSLKKTFQEKSGNVADINLLLTAILRKAGLQAFPILLSTRDNGKVNDEVPLLSQYNYVISKLEIDGTVYLLDASESKAGFGHLTAACYNGTGRTIDKMPYLVQLSADSVTNFNSINIKLKNGQDGKLTGNAYVQFGTFESIDYRNKYATSQPDEIVKSIGQEYSTIFKVSNLIMDDFKNYDAPLSMKYDLNTTGVDGDEEIIYFNPIITKGYTKNPFASASRLFPVEMPYCISDNYSLELEIPKGYSVDEIPKGARINFNDGEGIYEYLISKQDSIIKIRTKLFFKKANFPPDEYEVLRNFFGFIVKKQNEQIVFKKN